MPSSSPAVKRGEIVPSTGCQALHTKRPVRNRPAKAKRAQPTRRHSFRKVRLRVHGHPERPRRRDRRQVRVQPGRVARSRRISKPDTSGTYPRSCALTGMIPAKSGPATTDARPAAAAAASRWPMFDFREVHTVGARIARLAAPTCEETHSLKEAAPRTRLAPRWDPRAPCPCRALPAPDARRPTRPRAAAAATTRSAPSGSRSGRPVEPQYQTLRIPRQLPRVGTRCSLLPGNIHPRDDQMCDTDQARTASQRH